MTFIVIVLAMLLGCSERREYREALSRAEAAMNDHPDSALMILDSLGKHEQEFGKHFRMQYHLHLTNAQNRHRRDNHWKLGIGYHYVIRRNGTIEPVELTTLCVGSLIVYLQLK